MKADLHCHTKISDGSMGITEILMMAARLKIRYLAVTDHDTMGAVSRAAVVGKRLDIDVIPGAELSAFDYKGGKRVHLLCYLPDSPDRMEGFFKRMSDRRNDNFNKQIKIICEKLPITPQMVTTHTNGCTTVYKAHIMHTLMDAGYTNEIYGDLYKAFFAPGKPGDIKLEYDAYADVISLIKSAGGLAVLAHPGMYGNIDILDELVGLGLDGVEVEHHSNSPEQRDILRKYCVENKLLITGGSDFHGMYETPVRPLGSECVSELEVKALYERKNKKKVTVSQL